MADRVLKRPQVLVDLEEHFVAIGNDDLDAACRFLETAQAAFHRYAQWPYSARAWQSANPRLAGVRVGHMPRPFANFLIFDRPIENGVEVLTVQHGARDLQAVLDGLEP
jgi:toxin ParE1/3/4